MEVLGEYNTDREVGHSGEPDNSMGKGSPEQIALYLDEDRRMAVELFELRLADLGLHSLQELRRTPSPCLSSASSIS